MRSSEEEEDSDEEFTIRVCLSVCLLCLCVRALPCVVL